MPIRTTKRQTDSDVGAIMSTLGSYKAAHPAARIRVKRQNSVSIRIYIIDASFVDMSLTERDSAIWGVLERLPEEIQSQITMVLLLTPSEAKKSFVSAEFKSPIRRDIHSTTRSKARPNS